MRDYWLERAIKNEAMAHAMAEKAAEEMQKVYQRQYRKIVIHLERLYGQVQWQELSPKIGAENAKLSRTQLWNYSRWVEMEKQLAQFVDEGARMQINTVTKCLNGVFERVIGASAQDFAGGRSAAFRISTHPMSIINTAWSGESYSERIWHNTSAIAQRIKIDMEDMMVQGRGLSDIRRRLMNDFNVGCTDAARLVNTESAYVCSEASKARYRASGIRKVRWSIGAEDGKECELCRERKNKVYLIDRAPIIPAHPWCRCIYAGVVELPEEDIPVDTGMI